MKTEVLKSMRKNMNAKKYVRKWIKLLKATKPSESGFSVKSIREDRDNH